MICIKSKKYKNLIKLLSLITSLSYSANMCFAHGGTGTYKSKSPNNLNNLNNSSNITFKNNITTFSLLLGVPALIIGSIILTKLLSDRGPSSGFESLIPGVTDFLKNEESMKLYIKNELPKVTKILKKQNALATLDAKGDVMIIGDVHGTTEVIKYLIPETYNFLNSNKNNSVVILGDYIDTHGKPERDDSLAAALWFFNLIKLFPDRVRVLRGNHESVDCGLSESLKKYWCDNLKNCMDELPLACTIFHNNKKYFAVHGGIDWRVKIKNNGTESNLQKITLYSRDKLPPMGTDNSVMENQLMWNDFRKSNPEEKEIGICLGGRYSYPVYWAREFLHKFSYSSIIRGHDGTMNPVLELGNNKYVITVHSITLVPGDENLHARVAYITNDGLKIKYFLDNNRTVEIKDF